MSPELLDIQPQELKFTFELKKRSSCSVLIVNISDQYVAFKVKTTSPRKYCVRPNTGIVQPKSTCQFTVTMQVQWQAPPDMQCKDKFLVQSTIVPFGTTEEDITPSMFTKDAIKYIEEKKLRVVLVNPPDSPLLLPINDSPVVLPVKGKLKLEPAYEASSLKDQVLSGDENLIPLHMVAKAAEELKPGKDVELKPARDVNDLKFEKEIEELKLAKEDVELKLAKATDELNSKLNEWKSKLSEAEFTITRLIEERNTIIQEIKAIRQELAPLRRKNDVRRVNVGFSFPFVCMVVVIGVALGYLLHS